MNLHPISMPKPMRAPKMAAPKIASVHIHPVGGGFKVQRNMTHGPAQKPFVFADPKKMVQHINRIQASEWREPGRNEGPAVTRDLNLGPAS